MLAQTVDIATETVVAVASTGTGIGKGAVDTIEAVQKGVEEVCGAASSQLRREKPLPFLRRANSVNETRDDQHVILRIEIASSREAKVMRYINLFLMIVSSLAVAGLLVVKYKRDPVVALTQNNNFFLATLIICSCFEFSVLIPGAIFIRRLVEARKRRRIWSRRKAIVSGSAFLIVLMELINLSIMIVVYTELTTQRCSWKAIYIIVLGYVNWTLWNTMLLCLLVMAHNGSLQDSKNFQRRDLVMDAPIWFHAPKLFLWLVFQVFATLILWQLLKNRDRTASICDAEAVSCMPPKIQIVFLSIMMAVVGFYSIAYVYFSRKANTDICSRPYSSMRFARIVFGMQHEQLLPTFLAFSISIILTATVKLSSCWTYIETWFGVVPLHAMATSMAVSLAFFFMPKNPRGHEIMSSWLQEFSWTEEDMIDALAARNMRLMSSKVLAKEPMFCVETAIKLLNFSQLVYQIEDTGDDLSNEEMTKTKDVSVRTYQMESVDCQDTLTEKSRIRIKDSLSLYGLKDCHIIWDHATDTKVLIGSKAGLIILAFRGTSSFENVKTDLNFIKVPHEPRRLAPLSDAFFTKKVLKSLVLVHKGFYTAWTSVKDKVLARVGDLTEGCQECQLVVTGHSLGGALATLAAHNLRHEFEKYEIKVYTYGQPRVGNLAFALEYNSMIKEHFSIINDQDPVARVPKGWYKRVGNRILLTKQGDIVVRPTYLEMDLINLTGGRVNDHYTTSYANSLISIIGNQFSRFKCLPNGEEGASRLAACLDLNRTLGAVKMDLESLSDPTSIPMLQSDYEKLRTRPVSAKTNCNTSISCCGMGYRGDDTV